MIHEILKILDTTELHELEKQRITTDLLRLFNVVRRSEQLETCEHNFADVYDNTGTQIVGKKCLNGCGF